MTKTNKITGRYNVAAVKKALKGSRGRMLCQATEDGEIYLSNGEIILTMDADEYNAAARPVTMRDAGNWCITSTGEESAPLDLSKLLVQHAKPAETAGPLTRTPLELTTAHGAISLLYDAAQRTAHGINRDYLAMIPEAVELRRGATGSAVAYNGVTPYAMILPVRIGDGSRRAAAAYCTTPEDTAPTTDAAELAAAKAERDDLRQQLDALRAELAQAKAAHAEQPAPAPAAQPAPEPKTAAELIAQRWQAVEGLEVTIKGAQTSAPVIWLTGDTEAHADEIKQAGGKWSAKRSAFYFRVA